MKEKYQQLIRNLQFYQNNLAQFAQQYQGKYLLIWEERVVGIYLTSEDALVEANEEYEPGTYLLKHCQPELKVATKYASKNGIYQATIQA